jgi:hypothetical protein
VTVRDRKAEVEADAMLYRDRALSLKTYRARQGLDDETEEENLADEEEREDGFAGTRAGANLFRATDDDGEDDLSSEG